MFIDFDLILTTVVNVMKTFGVLTLLFAVICGQAITDSHPEYLVYILLGWISFMAMIGACCLVIITMIIGALMDVLRDVIDTKKKTTL